MELDERKEKILKAIIQTYLETGEPVGSRTISKYSGLKLSSATIRNEMSDLEELGYIIQPHTSAGRIPSDKGYRFYVDQIIQEKDSQVNTMHPPPAQCFFSSDVSGAGRKCGTQSCCRKQRCKAGGGREQRQPLLR